LGHQGRRGESRDTPQGFKNKKGKQVKKRRTRPTHGGGKGRLETNRISAGAVKTGGISSLLVGGVENSIQMGAGKKWWQLRRRAGQGKKTDHPSVPPNHLIKRVKAEKNK